MALRAVSRALSFPAFPQLYLFDSFDLLHIVWQFSHHLAAMLQQLLHLTVLLCACFRSKISGSLRSTPLTGTPSSSILFHEGGRLSHVHAHARREIVMAYSLKIPRQCKMLAISPRSPRPRRNNSINIFVPLRERRFSCVISLLKTGVMARASVNPSLDALPVGLM